MPREMVHDANAVLSAIEALDGLHDKTAARAIRSNLTALYNRKLRDLEELGYEPGKGLRYDENEQLHIED